MSMRGLFAVLLLVAGCAQPDAQEPVQKHGLEDEGSFRLVETPVVAGSRHPNLHATSDGRLILSWTQELPEGSHALQFSSLKDGVWSDVRIAAEGDNWFVNWADFPSVISLGGDRMAAHFLAKSADATYAYDVFVTQSSDLGKTWSDPVSPHTDGTPTEHGFVSMLPAGDGGVFATWLDGRNTGGHEEGGGAMSLGSGTLDASGKQTEETLIDRRICDCCQTSAGRTSDGLIVAYRDRSEEEIRDISVVRQVDGAWTDPVTIHDDGWHIAGCPVNGPSLAASGQTVAVAWFTAADGQPTVKLAFSTDGGETFSDPIRVDDGEPIGRVHVVLLGDGSAIVSWIEKTSSTAEIRVRRVSLDGALGASVPVASISGDRANGFPRMAVAGESLYISWTDVSDQTKVRVASTDLSSL